MRKNMKEGLVGLAEKFIEDDFFVKFPQFKEKASVIISYFRNDT